MNNSGSEKVKRHPAMTRSHFIGTTAAAAAAVAVLPGCASRMAITGGGQPSSGGVKIGVITYSYRGVPTDAESILGYLLEAGLSEVELMGNVIESYAGIPEVPRGAGRGGFRGAGGPPPGAPGAAPAQEEEPELTPEEQAAQEAAAAEAAAARAAAQEEQRLWRLSPPMEKFEALRKMYNDEGVNIHIAKLGSANWPEEQIDYAFNVARALGAGGICMEIGDEAAKVMAPFATKHDMKVIFHQHGQPGEPGFSFDPFLAYGPNNMLNFDVGHAFGATGEHPNVTIERLHDRIFSLHLKDKTGPTSDPPDTNMPWGQGETPLADILLLVKREGWPIYADIELEYSIPEGSTSVEEVKKCAEFCREILG